MNSQTSHSAARSPSLVLTENSAFDRFFLTAINSLLGHAFVELARNDHISDSPNIFTGLLSASDESPAPSGATRAFPADSPMKDVLNLVADANVIVVEVMQTDIELLNRLHHFLYRTVFARKKRLIIVSSPLLWSESRGAVASLPEHLSLRKCLPCYEIHRLLEHSLLSIGESNESVETALLVPGVAYGRGEDGLFRVFAEAVEGRPIFAVDRGSNLLPLIHVDELAAGVKRLAGVVALPQRIFFLSEKPVSQSRALGALAETLSVPLKEVGGLETLLREDFHTLSLDLTFVSSELFVRPDREAMPCFVDQVSAIFEQFRLHRGLNAGVSFLVAPSELLARLPLSEQLRERLDVESYTLETLLALARASPSHEDAEFVESLAPRLEADAIASQDAAFAAALEVYNQGKKQRKKNLVEPRREEFVFDEIRGMSPTTAVDLVRFSLRRPRIRRAGVLICGFPRSAEETSLLLEAPEVESLELMAKLNVSEAVVEKISLEAASIPGQSALVEAVTQYAPDTILASAEERQVKIATYRVDDLDSPVTFPDWPPASAAPLSQTPASDPKPDSLPENPLRDDQNEQDSRASRAELLKLVQEEEEVLNNRSANLRQYLADNVLPDLTEAVVEICKVRPEEPVEFLLEFLRKKIGSEAF